MDNCFRRESVRSHQSSDYFTHAAEQIGLSFGIPDFMVGLTIVAIGTSLLEIVSSIFVVLSNSSQIVVGNVVGSNILNAFAVMGIPALPGKLVIPHSIITFGIPMMLIASLLFFFMGQDKEITQWEGWLLLIFYVFFIGKLFAIG